MMKQRLRLAALIASVFLLLTSCISVDTSIQLSANGTGTVTLHYTVSKMVAELGRVDPSWQGVPLPVEQTDFQSTVAAVPGLTLNAFSRSETDDAVNITASLSFTSIAALNGLYSAGGQSIAVTTTGGTTQYHQLLFQGFPDGVDAQSKQFATDFFSDYALTFDLQAPSPIKSANLGTISGDRRSVHYAISIPQLLDQKQPLAWDISW